MKKILLILAILALAGCATSAPKAKTFYQSYEATGTPPMIANKIYMNIISPDFINGDFLPADLSCQGEGRAPLLQIANVPTSTASLALVVDDPDAPAGVFTHWLVWNISAAAKTIDAKNLPSGAVVGANSGGTNKYFPPCPPSGVHHYYYRLYALDEKLKLPAKTNMKNLLKAMTGHILDEAVLMGKYQKK
ncbi:MAG: YbhB/YbcL family Raf kinase inhibitor-like protein [Patescibacteria group bacterium]|nr:YbhB/YbcL family Raf kinase inhibitor-like protein [Patescibacteria group bacterium]